MITCGGSRFAARKMISSVTLKRKLSRDTTNATHEAKNSVITTAGTVMSSEFQK